MLCDRIWGIKSTTTLSGQREDKQEDNPQEGGDLVNLATTHILAQRRKDQGCKGCCAVVQRETEDEHLTTAAEPRWAPGGHDGHGGGVERSEIADETSDQERDIFPTKAPVEGILRPC
jgi:hypothetical protein